MLRDLASIRFIVEIIRHALSNDLYDHDRAVENSYHIHEWREDVNIIEEVQRRQETQGSYGF